MSYAKMILQFPVEFEEEGQRKRPFGKCLFEKYI